MKNLENSQIESIMAKRPVDLMLFEVSEEVPTEVELIKRIGINFPTSLSS